MLFSKCNEKCKGKSDEITNTCYKNLYWKVTFSIITVRNEVAKVMFLHLCVCPQGALPHCMLNYHSLEQTQPSWSRRPGADTPPGAGTPRAAPPQEQTPPLQQTATVVDGTHPTGMHSCWTLICKCHEGGVIKIVCHFLSWFKRLTWDTHQSIIHQNIIYGTNCVHFLFIYLCTDLYIETWPTVNTIIAQ